MAMNRGGEWVTPIGQLAGRSSGSNKQKPKHRDRGFRVQPTIESNNVITTSHPFSKQAPPCNKSLTADINACIDKKEVTSRRQQAVSEAEAPRSWNHEVHLQTMMHNRTTFH